MTLLFICLGLVFVLVGLWRYFKSFVVQSDPVAFAKFTVGNISFELSDVLCLLILGCGVLGYCEFLRSRVVWRYILSEDHISKSVREKLSTLVPQEYRELLKMGEEKEKLPEDERLLDLASGLYYRREFGKCLNTLLEIKPSNEGVRDEVLYYSIMAQYRLLEEEVKRYETIPPEKLRDLESKFVLFLKERRESKRFGTIQYWLGQFYLQVCKDEDKALCTFDDIIKNYAYSDWIQGSLYYSAILHNKKGTPSDKQIASDNLKKLRTIDKLLKIVETDRDVDSAGMAEQLLGQWKVAQDSNTTPDDVNKGK